MAVLVTGGAGFIGSHTCVSLLESGREIIVADNFSNSSPDTLLAAEKIAGKKIVCYEIDVCDREAVFGVFSRHNIDSVIHFAGYKAVGESVSMPLEYYNNNLNSTIVICEAMKKYGCKNIVFSSSATVYGDENLVPLVENMSTKATNPYGWTKVMNEQILRDFAVANEGVNAVLLRYFNPIGAHETGLIGENPKGIPNNLFPYICRVATGILPCVNVFGGDYDTPDGTGVRDYIHVCDLARGHVLALDYCEKGSGETLAVNLGTGRGTSVLELIEAFKTASGHDIPYVIAPRRPGDLASCYAECNLARETLGFQAEFTITDMCRDGWNYIKNQM